MIPFALTENREQVEALIHSIRKIVTRPWALMEICGGQTHAIVRYRLEEMLPQEVKLLHGPGCPVCVTPTERIDQAIELAKRPDVILASFGDMIRVPGTHEDLQHAKACGANVRILYTPLDAVDLAEANPCKQVIFFAIGFETTAPVYLITLKEAIRRKLRNFFLLTSLFTVPPAIEAILSDPNSCVNGFLTAGHVCTITGNGVYRTIAKKYRTPMVVTGFKPIDLLQGIYHCLLQLETGMYTVENTYQWAVSEEGNLPAQALMAEMLDPCDQNWRGIGRIAQSGLRLKADFLPYNADSLLSFINNKKRSIQKQSDCIAGEIMKGSKHPVDCPFFGTRCIPNHPIGAPMVSAEGVCAAYYTYK